MTAQLIDPNQCQFNKFQPKSRRVFVDADLVDLESIKDHSLYYAIKVYEEPGRPGWYFVKDGWRRVQAWLRWRPSEPIPADVEDAPTDDRALFEQAVISNEGRENFNAIQKADLCAQAIELGLTQAQAGQLFNPPIQQTAVSHLLSLRTLPDQVKAHVESGALPERFARPLVTIAKHAPNPAIAAANAIAGASKDEKEDRAGHELWTAYCKAFQQLWTWNPLYTWPTHEQAVHDARPDKGEPSTITACTDCKFKVEFERSQFCTRPACYKLKERLLKARDKKASQRVASSTSTGRPDAATLAKDKARREAEEAEARRRLAAAIEAISCKLPTLAEPYLSFFTQYLDQDATYDDDNVPEWMQAYHQLDRHALAKLKPAEKAHFVKGMIITQKTWSWSAHPADVSQNIAKLCAEWKVKLPKGWDTAAKAKAE